MKIKKEKVNWKQVVLGRVPGILLGTRGTLAGNAENGEVEVLGEHYPDAVSDEMAFGEAFTVARAELGSGGVFEWRGNLYSTDTVEEWNATHGQDSQDEIPVEQDAIEDEVVIFGDSDANENPEVMVIDMDGDGDGDFVDGMDEGEVGMEEVPPDTEAYDSDVMDGDEYTNDVI